MFIGEMGSFFRLLDRADQGRYKIDRKYMNSPVQKWTTCTAPVKDGCVGRVHCKLASTTQSSNLSRSEYMQHVCWPWTHRLLRRRKGKARSKVAGSVSEQKAISPEEAEQLSSAMIKSFSSCPLMRELLEDAKYFVGAGGLVGAPPSRRARTKRVISDTTVS